MAAHKLEVEPIGYIHHQKGQVRIEIKPEFEPALMGLSQFSHIWVLYWFHENDTPQKRRTLQVHPRGNPANPLTGVFATHSPVRPNLIAMTHCRLIAVDGLNLTIDTIDARDLTPVIDIKSYFPPDLEDNEVYLPPWAKRVKSED